MPKLEVEESIVKEVRKVFPSVEGEVDREKRVTFTVDPATLRDLALHLRDKQGFDYPLSVGGVDYLREGKFMVVYHVSSSSKKVVAAIKTFVPRDNPRLPSLVDVWEGINWHERETWELMGITFEGHPNLSILLLQEDWDHEKWGYPLRKDFKGVED